MIKHSSLIIAFFVVAPVFANTAIQSRAVTIEPTVERDQFHQVQGYERKGYCAVNTGRHALVAPKYSWYPCDSTRPPVSCANSGREGMICSVGDTVGTFSTIRGQANEGTFTE